MKINKKNKYAERIKNKILDLINSIESSNKELKFYEEYKTAYGDIYPNTEELYYKLFNRLFGRKSAI